jgi:hypothetical protein
LPAFVWLVLPTVLPTMPVEEVCIDKPVIDQVDVGSERETGVGMPEPASHLLWVATFGEQD